MISAETTRRPGETKTPGTVAPMTEDKLIRGGPVTLRSAGTRRGARRHDSIKSAPNSPERSMGSQKGAAQTTRQTCMWYGRRASEKKRLISRGARRKANARMPATIVLLSAVVLLVIVSTFFLGAFDVGRQVAVNYIISYTPSTRAGLTLTRFRSAARMVPWDGHGKKKCFERPVRTVLLSARCDGNSSP